MKTILGLDLGTNSIGWSIVKQDFENQKGEILGLGTRIIPMSQDILGKFESGQSVSQTAERTAYRGTRRLYERAKLRRERLHRVLNCLNFLPEHYKNEIDFDKNFGKLKKEVKLNYRKKTNGEYEFLFKDSYNEMVNEFKKSHPKLFYKKSNGEETKIPYDWTLYYLRKKALSSKLTKEELAWLILNFNQKRGYYQLRGDELNDENNTKKNETYYSLKVKDVIETEEKTNKGIWYKVVLENGWIYKRQSKEPLHSWIGTTKEFIVTTSTTKNGEIKPSFRAPKEDDWSLIKKKTEQDLDAYIDENENHTVGTYIYDTLLKIPNQKIRGKLIKTIERKYYRQELIKILNKQKEFHSELKSKELYEQCINELYPHNESHKNSLRNKDRMFTHLFVDDIIFYQRPLKSQKGTIGGCQFETRTYKKTITNEETNKKQKITITEPLKAVNKSHPLYQEFRLWQWIQNLRIYQKYDDNGRLTDKDITKELLQNDDDYANLFDFLNNRKEIKQSVLLGYFFKSKKEKENHRWNYPEEKTYPMNETKAEMLNRLKKVSNITPTDFLTPETEYSLWHIIYSVKDPIQFKTALKTFAIKHQLNPEEFVSAFEKHPPYDNDYGAFSEKALKKLLPLMRMGKYWDENKIQEEVKERIHNIMERVNALNLPENPSKKQINEAFEKYDVTDDDIPQQLIKSFIPFINKNPLTGLNTYQASYAVYGRHSEIGDIQQWKSPQDIDKYLQKFKQHSLRNPIVEQVVTETLRTVRDIWKHYGDGKENFFDEIHVELGRELKNPADKRKQIAEKQNEEERTNERIRLLLKELINEGARPHSPNHLEILKIYEEGVYQSMNNVDDDIEKIRKNNSPTQKEIQRYKLWLEQGYVSPYTGQIIPLSQLFSDKYQIEHIIPQSRYFDDSLSNKVICESAVNELKSNQTAYEFIKEKGGSKVDLGQGHSVEILKWEDYEAHCNEYFKKNKAKLKKLLTDEIPEGFINRQLNDSRYIAKLVKSLLGNIVRQDGELEATPKNLIAVTGAITDKLKRDWGLNDKWNELIMPRFKRLQKMFPEKEFVTQNTNGIEIPTVPLELKKGFSKKRIDHRHHALDAVVIACCTRKHIQYINSLNNQKEKYELQPALMVKNEHGDYTKAFRMPWTTFPIDVKKMLETTIISFKQNLRVINRTNNKYWKYVKQEDGSFKKKLVKQKGKNFAIRKPLHKETVSGLLKETASKGKKYTAVRTDLSSIKNAKHLEKITDSGIQKILTNHLKNYTNEKGQPDFEKAFSPEGIKDLNDNIIKLNNGKKHQPIYKVRFKEEGSKFPLSHNKSFNKHKKYVEAAKGTNLYFAIYINEKGERKFETVPLFDVIEHQKQQALENTPKELRTPIPVNKNLGNLLFTLSPNDLVYVPTDEEINNPELVDKDNLTKEQVDRIYKMVSTTKNECHFIPNQNASEIIKNENGTNSKSERLQEFLNSTIFDNKNKPVMIKSRCWKLKINRLGIIETIIK